MGCRRSFALQGIAHSISGRRKRKLEFEKADRQWRFKRSRFNPIPEFEEFVGERDDHYLARQQKWYKYHADPTQCTTYMMEMIPYDAVTGDLKSHIFTAPEFAMSPYWTKKAVNKKYQDEENQYVPAFQKTISYYSPYDLEPCSTALMNEVDENQHGIHRAILDEQCGYEKLTRRQRETLDGVIEEEHMAWELLDYEIDPYFSDIIDTTLDKMQTEMTDFNATRAHIDPWFDCCSAPDEKLNYKERMRREQAPELSYCFPNLFAGFMSEEDSRLPLEVEVFGDGEWVDNTDYVFPADAPLDKLLCFPGDEVIDVITLDDEQPSSSANYITEPTTSDGLTFDEIMEVLAANDTIEVHSIPNKQLIDDEKPSSSTSYITDATTSDAVKDVVTSDNTEKELVLILDDAAKDNLLGILAKVCTQTSREDPEEGSSTSTRKVEEAPALSTTIIDATTSAKNNFSNFLPSVPSDPVIDIPTKVDVIPNGPLIDVKGIPKDSLTNDLTENSQSNDVTCAPSIPNVSCTPFDVLKNIALVPISSTPADNAESDSDLEVAQIFINAYAQIQTEEPSSSANAMKSVLNFLPSVPNDPRTNDPEEGSSNSTRKEETPAWSTSNSDPKLSEILRPSQTEQPLVTQEIEEGEILSDEEDGVQEEVPIFHAKFSPPRELSLEKFVGLYDLPEPEGWKQSLFKLVEDKKPQSMKRKR